MRHRKIIGTIIVLLFLPSKYYIHAAGLNGGNSSTNENDLKEIASKMEEGLRSMKSAWEQINTMKTEQHAFEIDLRHMLENYPHAPTEMKLMLEDQNSMQDQVTNIQMDVKECQDKFGNLKEDIKKLQENSTNNATYEALKLFIRELDALADQLTTFPKKFLYQAKRYKEFGQSMLDSENIDVAVNKRLCALGSKIEDLGYQLSDTGDPITITSEKIANIRQRTNPKDKDHILSRVIMNLTPKGDAIIADGKSQATGGTALKTICENIAEKVESQSQPPESQRDPEACKIELDAIGKGLEELSSEGSDLEKLRENLEIIANLETEFESLAKLVPDPGKISKELKNLANGMSNIKQALTSAADKAKGVKSCDGNIIEGLGNTIHGVYSLLLGIARESEHTAGKLFFHGMDLVDQTEFEQELKAKYDIVGEKFKSVGSLMQESSITPKIVDTGQRFANIGKSLKGDSGNTLLAIGNIIRGVVEPLQSHWKKVSDYGIEISSLQATKKKIPEIKTDTEKSGSVTGKKKPGKGKNKKSGNKKPYAKDIKQMQTDLFAIDTDLQNIIQDLEVIEAKQEAVELEAGQGYEKKKKVVIKKINALTKHCKNLSKEIKSIGKDLKKAKKASATNIGKLCKECVPKTLLDLAEKMLDLGEKLEALGKMILANGIGLKKKGLLTAPLIERLKVQGVKAESCGTKLQNISGKFDGIASKLVDIGGKVAGENGEALKEAGEKLKEIIEKIKLKGKKGEEFGTGLQGLGTRDISKDNDDEDDKEDDKETEDDKENAGDVE